MLDICMAQGSVRDMGRENVSIPSLNFFWALPTLISIHDFLASLFWVTHFIFLVSQARKPMRFPTYATTAVVHAMQTVLRHRQKATEIGIDLYGLLSHFSPANVPPLTSLSASIHSPVLFCTCSGSIVVS